MVHQVVWDSAEKNKEFLAPGRTKNGVSGWNGKKAFICVEFHAAAQNEQHLIASLDIAPLTVEGVNGLPEASGGRLNDTFRYFYEGARHVWGWQ